MPVRYADRGRRSVSRRSKSREVYPASVLEEIEHSLQIHGLNVSHGLPWIRKVECPAFAITQCLHQSSFVAELGRPRWGGVVSELINAVSVVYGSLRRALRGSSWRAAPIVIASRGSLNDVQHRLALVRLNVFSFHRCRFECLEPKCSARPSSMAECLCQRLD